MQFHIGGIILLVFLIVNKKIIEDENEKCLCSFMMKSTKS